MPELREVLERHIALGFAGTRHFFHAEHQDRPLSTAAGREWIRKAFTAAGLKYGRGGDAVTPDSLRHTFASWAILAGVPVNAIADQLGNTPAVVLSTYAHLWPHNHHEAVARVSKGLRKVQEEMREQRGGEAA